MTDESARGPEPGSRQGLFWLALLLAAALALAGAAFAVGAYVDQSRPDTVVREFFAAVARGDAAGALGYGDLPAGRHDLLTGPALAAQLAEAPMSGLVVVGTHGGNGTATVDVRYTLDYPTGPTTVVDRVPVVRRGHGWRLAHSAVPETVRAGDGSDRATVVGAAVPDGDFALFPGAAPVAFDTPNLQLAAADRTVRFDGDGLLTVTADVSAAGRRAIVPALARAFTACLAGTSTVEPLCPVPDADTAVPGSLRGRPATLDPARVTLLVAASGDITIAGSATMAGTVANLDANDLAVTAPATTVSLHAHCQAVDPRAISWDQP